MKTDIYGMKRRLELIEAGITAAGIREKGRLFQFRDQCFAEGLGLHRITKYLQLLKKLCEASAAPLGEISPMELTGILAGIERTDLSAWTKHDQKLALRKYLAFCKRDDLVKLIRVKGAATNKLPEELLSTQDISDLLESSGAGAPGIRALVYVLWDSGCRIGEILGIQKKNVIFDTIGAVLTVEGKTGMRRIRVIESAGPLNEWISERALNPDDRVFPLKYEAARKQISVLAKKAGIQKRIYPHLFRHSRATHLAGYLKEAQLCAHMGWTVGSQMARIYVHLNGSDLDLAMMKIPAIMPKVQSPTEDMNQISGETPGRFPEKSSSLICGK
ncbi:MAG: tyrosine-type recombinase/integrase [Thaumarchaeota archaeon]|nr:tyrosine-type recombinase/integrase [Nitrososphaerota archaeon]